MSSLLQWMKGRVRKAIERDRRAEKYMERISWLLWPWAERKLLFFVSAAAALDYASTYTVLELSGKRYLNEGGPLARWALEKGGFGGLFLADLAAVLAIVTVALILRYLLLKAGFEGFGRAALVFLLVPYGLMALVAVFNNLVLAFI